MTLELPEITYSGPTPLWTLAAIIALWPILRCGTLICSIMIKKEYNYWPTSLLVGIILWSLTIDLFSRTTGNFYKGFAIGTSLLAIVGSLWGQTPKQVNQNIKQKYLLVILIIVSYLPLIILYDFADLLHSSVSHYSYINQILNGIFPLTNITSPQLPIQYHYGFELICAIISAAFHLRMDIAVNIVFILALMLTILIAMEFSREYMGNGSIIPGAALFVFAGGLPYLAPVTPTANNLYGYLAGNQFSIGKWSMALSFPFNFFQPAWSIGIPLFLVILQASLSKGIQTITGIIFYGILILALAIINTTLALTGVVSIIGATIINYWKQPLYCFSIFTISASALGVGFLMSGMLLNFQVTSNMPSPILLSQSSVGGGGLSSIRWHIANFGSLGILGFIGLYWPNPIRITALLLILGSVAVLNLFEYRYSYDIIKFSTTAQIGLILTTLVFLSKIERGKIILLFSCCIAGIAFLGTGILKNPNPYRPDTNPKANAIFLDETLVSLPHDTIDSLKWLRNKVKRGEALAADENISLKITVLSGIPTYFVDPLGISTQPQLISTLIDRKQIKDTTDFESKLKSAQVRWIFETSLDTEEWKKLIYELQAQNIIKKEYSKETTTIWSVNTDNTILN